MRSGPVAPNEIAVSEPLPTNALLIKRCQTGDQQAWSTIVSRYERLVYGIALREGCGNDLAADVAQETFAQLLRALDSIEQPQHLGRWLATVCRRDVWRRRTKTTDISLELSGDLLTPTPDFSDHYVTSAEVHEAVLALPDPCRSLIFGLFFDPDEPDYAAIAVRLGRPIGSIGPLRGRCLSHLRQIIEARSHDER